MKRYFFPFLSVSMVFLTLWACKKESAQIEVIRPVRAIQIGSVKELTGRSFPGKARAFNEVDLGFEAAGTVTERAVNKGDSVKEGQVLARLDPRDFQNTLDAALAERDRAKTHRDRIAQAATTGAVAKIELTNAETRLKVAEAEVKIKRKALEDAVITAPFDGYISVTYVENYQRVRPKQPVVRLLDQSRLKFDVGIPENLISKVSNVKDIFVKFDAFPDRELTAVMGEVGTEASEATRTYPITLYLEQPEGISIMPGMAGKAYGKGQAEPKNESSEFEVPVTAILEKDGKSYVWVIDETAMTVSLKEVTTEKLTNFGIMVKGDLKPGDWLTTAGVHYLKEGQKVRLLNDHGGNSGEV